VLTHLKGSEIESSDNDLVVTGSDRDMQTRDPMILSENKGEGMECWILVTMEAYDELVGHFNCTA
jgi:hypothetical protein